MRETDVQYNFRKLLESKGYGCESLILESERSNNKEIDALLQTASKSGKNQRGYPDFIIHNPKKKMIMVIEVKANTQYHKKGDMKHKQKTAVEGVLHYAQKLKVKYDVIALAVSSLGDNSFKISSFYWGHDKDLYKNLDLKDELYKFEKYENKINEEKDRKTLSEKELKKISANLNSFMRNFLEVTEERRALLAGAILIALDNSIFNISYHLNSDQNALAKQLHETVIDKIKTKIIDSERLKNIESELSFIKNIRSNDKGKKDFAFGALTELINIFRDKIHPYYKKSPMDVIGYFFTTFLKYATNGGGDLGVVLTPSHIGDIFSRIANINENSKIFDPCMGTGTFLVDAWKKISTSTKKDINANDHIYGVEFKPQMFTLAIINMILNGDGTSNLKLGSCFDNKIIDEISDHGCNVGFINPPYSHSTEPEIKFVENMLDILSTDSLGIAIIPVNAVSNQSKTHGNIKDIKERLLRKHTLIASIQMPTQIFYPKGTETVILVFKTKTKHDYKEKVWFAKLDDGYKMIKQQGRVASENSEIKIKEFIDAYKTKKETVFSFLDTISYDEQWIYSVIKSSDYTLEEEDFKKTLKEYNAFMYLNGYTDEI